MNILIIALLLITCSQFSSIAFASATTNLDVNQEIKPKANEKAVISQLLNNFLANSVNDDLANHQRFWAEDLIYTSSSGTRFDKSYIIQGIKENSKADENSDTLPPLYWAEDTDIRVYGDTAIVAFKLMHKENAKAKAIKQTYFNTGTLLKRDGIWQVVAWQATKIPAK
ncbi:nuclear transport factor 2 family protein [Thalassotalea euphylliae]|uniref:Nuclear transport factor 2 family protein n=1 Tax=Thalassotalea euphylliae TaxID=1655234 RepID=A0A3E0UFK5_9GAMM|nr:nuclear transport factor 2 family protein [Thalassotalea euphylliae]REL35357.1 nuclear transport factor 2 family protein [Thalassotalea euphylliae]